MSKILFHSNLICVIVALMLVAPVGVADDLVATLEAQFLERFTRFIEWPSNSTVADPSIPFVIGVFSHDDIMVALGKIAASTTVKGKTLELRTIETPMQSLGCNVVFVGPGSHERLKEIIGVVAGRPILVVSDSRGFARRGSMINFIIDGEFVRFEVNPKAAEANGLRFAPELLSLGETVK